MDKTTKNEKSGDRPYQDPVPVEFDEFYLVLLDHGPNRQEPETDEERDQLQRNQLAHLQMLKDLYDQGYSIGAGPFTDGKGGLIILRGNSLSKEDIERLLNDDAHIQTGRLVPRIRKFVVPKGIL
jgi:uncharacterized protein YciI